MVLSADAATVSPDPFAGLAGRIDRLHGELGTPVDAARPWLEEWIRCYTDHDLLVVTVADGNGDLEGFAPLAVRGIGPVRRVVSVGDGHADHTSVIATTPDASARLGRAIRVRLDELRRPWGLHLARLPGGPTTDALVASLPPHGGLNNPIPCPIVEFDRGRDPLLYETRNARQAVSRAKGRIRRAGLDLTVGLVTEPDEVVALLPALLEIHRNRDVQLRGGSGLDRAMVRAHYVGVVRRMAGLGLVRLLTARIDGVLAAYALGVFDAGTLRIYDNRVSPAFLDYSVGNIANSAVLRAALASPDVDALDWGAGDQRYKRSTATSSPVTHDLSAWSSRLAQRAWQTRTAARRR